MKILVVGSGGREHAIVMALSKSKEITKLYAAPGNGGISELAECVPISAVDVTAMVDFAKNNAIDYVVVTPDDPLVLGMVDALKAEGIEAFGPSKAAAQIEGSKVFSKQLMEKYNIPTAQYKSFSKLEEALAFVEKEDKPWVIKADGLALGKGVLLCQNANEAKEALVEMMEKQKFGSAGNRVVVEEMLYGPEVSVLCFTDGKTIKPMVSSMDHKRALDGDAGLNTGGMGVIAPNPYYTKEIADTCMQEIFLPTLKAMQAENAPFTGCLYFGLMLTSNGPKVIEYNCRFGDPETQAVLPLLQDDLLKIMLATTRGTLENTSVNFAKQSSCAVVLASGGYPSSYKVGKVINGLDQAKTMAWVQHAGTKKENNELYTAGGRVLAVTAVACDLPTAINNAYKAVNCINFEDMHYRKDIGALALRCLRK